MEPHAGDSVKPRDPSAEVEDMVLQFAERVRRTHLGGGSGSREEMPCDESCRANFSYSGFSEWLQEAARRRDVEDCLCSGDMMHLIDIFQRSTNRQVPSPHIKGLDSLLQTFRTARGLKESRFANPVIVASSHASSSSSPYKSYPYVFGSSKDDLESYRNKHPELVDEEGHLSGNVDFYRGAVPHPTYGCFIDDFHNVPKYRGDSAATTEHSTWFGNYGKLEREHAYIQHLFPLQEGRGLSPYAQRLQKHEMATMIDDSTIQKRLRRSLETMYDFFGIEMESDNPNFLRRSDRCDKCYDNLNFSPHNYLRITRILKCIGDLGHEDWKEALVEFFVVEAFEWPQGESCKLANVRSPLEGYWVETVRDDEKRKSLKNRIDRGKDSRVSEERKRKGSTGKWSNKWY
jgi:hypothetical protein